MPATRCSSIRDERSGRGCRAWLRRWLGLLSSRFEAGSSASPVPAVLTGLDHHSGDELGSSARALSSQQIGPDPLPGAKGVPPSPGMVDPRSRMMALLERAEGASVTEIAAVTGWQAHSVRAALSGLRKRGVVIERIGQVGRACRHRAVEAAGHEIAGTSALASADPFGAAAPSSDVLPSDILPSDVLRPPDGALAVSASSDRPEGAA